MGSYVSVLGPRFVELFGKDEKVRIVGGGVSLKQALRFQKQMSLPASTLCLMFVV